MDEILLVIIFLLSLGSSLKLFWFDILKLYKIVFQKKVVPLEIEETKNVFISIDNKNGQILKEGLNYLGVGSNDISCIKVVDVPETENIAKKNLNWKEIPEHFKVKVKNNQCPKVTWEMIKGYLV